jgi:hypothetical protein
MKTRDKLLRSSTYGRKLASNAVYGKLSKRTETARQVYDAYCAVNTAITIALEVGIDLEQFLDLVRGNWAAHIERAKEKS